MAQTYKMMLGTSGKQWEKLTVKDDGTMTLYFHGTDRSVTQQVTAVTEGEWKGWLRSEKGSMWPGLESGKWNKMDDGRGLMADGRCKTEDVTIDHSPLTVNPELAVPVESEPTLRGQAPCNPPSATHTGDSPREPRPRRQRKPRKSAVALDRRTAERTSAISHQTSDVDRQPSSTLKAIGMVAAASVALFVIYETGLLIPLGLIGLATGGILK